MATERQIAANRRNSARSTGPRSTEGKSRSRANATRHGMAGASAMVEPGLSAEFEARRASWAIEHHPIGEAGQWALDRAVAASLRIERCERAMDELVATTRERAELAWDQDRAVEAATVAGRLARDPVLASRQLETTWAGVGLLLDSWIGLVRALDGPGGWSESDASTALDLLGIPAGLRAGPTAIDGPEGSDPVAFRRALALDEIDRLERLRDEALAPLDDLDRRQAMTGDIALLSKPAKLLLRYERDAWRRYRESIREARGPAAEPGVAVPSRPIEPACLPSPSGKGSQEKPVLESPSEDPTAAPARSFADERRALLEEAARVLSGIARPSLAIDLDDFDDDDRWLDDLERRLDGPFAALEPSIPTVEGTPASG